jgi:hypothetical protein
MDEDKGETVQNWSRENMTGNGKWNYLSQVQSFLGFCNYYWSFIPNYSEKPGPLTWLTNNEEPFVWGAEQQLPFERIVNAFTTAPALRNFDPASEVIIDTDTPDYVSAGVLLQRDDEEVLHHLAHYSKKHSPAECNYDIYDQELIAIIKSLEEWRPECQGVAYPLQLITDHKNLEYFMTKNLLNQIQARWAELLTRFDYEIVYCPGKLNGKADALTNRPGDLPQGGDESLKNMEQVVLKPHNLPEQLMISANGIVGQEAALISDLFVQAYMEDQLPSQILNAIRQRDSSKEITVAECTKQDGQVWYRGKRYVPEGDQYVWNCLNSDRSRTSRHATFEVL